MAIAHRGGRAADFNLDGAAEAAAFMGISHLISPGVIEAGGMAFSSGISRHCGDAVVLHELGDQRSEGLGLFEFSKVPCSG